jgi:hypothetical protein
MPPPDYMRGFVVNCEGWFAEEAGCQPEENPYMPGDEAANLWAFGWKLARAARKKAGG